MNEATEALKKRYLQKKSAEQAQLEQQRIGARSESVQTLLLLTPKQPEIAYEQDASISMAHWDQFNAHIDAMVDSLKTYHAAAADYTSRSSNLLPLLRNCIAELITYQAQFRGVGEFDVPNDYEAKAINNAAVDVIQTALETIDQINAANIAGLEPMGVTKTVLESLDDQYVEALAQHAQSKSQKAVGLRFFQESDDDYTSSEEEKFIPMNEDEQMALVMSMSMYDK